MENPCFVQWLHFLVGSNAPFLPVSATSDLSRSPLRDSFLPTTGPPQKWSWGLWEELWTPAITSATVPFGLGTPVLKWVREETCLNEKSGMER